VLLNKSFLSGFEILLRKFNTHHPFHLKRCGSFSFVVFQEFKKIRSENNKNKLDANKFIYTDAVSVYKKLF